MLPVGYVDLRKPTCVNDLPLQKVFWDRRVVLQMLDKIGVPTSKRLECNRDGGPQLDKRIADKIEQSLGIRVDKPRPMSEFSMRGDDTIVIDGKTMDKPFVEKPVSGENHNVNIYFAKNKGGGARRLFRKVSPHSCDYKLTAADIYISGRQPIQCPRAQHGGTPHGRLLRLRAVYRRRELRGHQSLHPRAQFCPRRNAKVSCRGWDRPPQHGRKGDSLHLSIDRCREEDGA